MYNVHNLIMFKIDNNFLRKIVKIALSQGGVTADMVCRKILTNADMWLFPKYPDKTIICRHDSNLIKEINNFINANRKLLSQQHCFLGMWLHPKTRDYYLDITTSVKEQEQAIKTARKISRESERKIVSVYNLLTKKTVFL